MFQSIFLIISALTLIGMIAMAIYKIPALVVLPCAKDAKGAITTKKAMALLSLSGEKIKDSVMDKTKKTGKNLKSFVIDKSGERTKVILTGDYWKRIRKN